MTAAARIALVLAIAAWNLVPGRGVAFASGLLLHGVATLAWLWLVRGAVRGHYRPSLLEACGLAILLRLLVLPLAPALSDDVHRYVYEGQLVLQGGNPYLTAPADAPPELRGETWELINNKEVPAAYPPATQLALALGVAIDPSPWGMKVVFGLFDLLVFVALWCWLPRIGVARERAVIHGLCPLMVLEFAGEGHNDSLAVLFMVLALLAHGAGRHAAAGGALAVATAGKFLPAVLLPSLWRRWWGVGPVFLLVAAALYLPFLAGPEEMFRGAREYTARWRGNESLFCLIIEPLQLLEDRGLLGGLEAQRLAKIPLAALGLGLLAHGFRRRWPAHRVGASFFLFYVAFTPVLHPWYLAFLVPFLCVYPNAGWLVFTGTVFLAYHVLPGWQERGVWQERGWVKVLEYAPFYLGLILAPARRSPNNGAKRPADGSQPPPA